VLSNKIKFENYIIFLPLLFISFASYGFAAINKIISFITLFLLYTQIKKLNLKRIKTIILILLIYIIGLLSLLSSKLFHISAFINDSMFLLLLLSASIILYKKEFFNSNFDRLFFNFLILSLYIHIIYIILLFINDNLLFNMDYGQLRFKGSMGSSATSIYYLSLFIPFFIRYIYSKEKKYLFLSILLIILILLCGTRITILALIFVIMINIINNIYGYKKILFLILFFIATAFIIDSLISRLFFNNHISISNLNMSGRNLLWSALIEKFPDSEWFGFGTGSTYTYLKIVNPLGGLADDQVHNDYIKILFNFGYIGLFLFLCIIKNMFNFLSKNNSHTLKMNIEISKNYIYSFLILMITDNVLVYIFFIYPWIIYYFYTIEKIRKEKNENRVTYKYTSSL
jgi:O-antigen ligase